MIGKKSELWTVVERSGAKTICGGGVVCRSDTAAGNSLGCLLTSQQDIDSEVGSGPRMCLQHPQDCVGVGPPGAMHASKGVAAPINITSMIDSEIHRRITRDYFSHVSWRCDPGHST